MMASRDAEGRDEALAPIQPSVLVVDDKPANLLALSAVLRPLGVRIVEARSGREALERFSSEPFAVVLLDAQMPEMDGFEVARRIRASQRDPDVPIIFLTAVYREESYARRGYASRAADYITKPFDPTILRARVGAFVDLFRQRDAVRRTQLALRTEERDEAVRRLVAFERIATAALRGGDLDAFLRELLDTFAEVTRAVDSAAILLRSSTANGPDVLRLRVAIGKLAMRELSHATERVGEGFAGRIAATLKPWEIDDASSSNVVVSPLLQGTHVSTIFGVPLASGGDARGVAFVASSRPQAFAERDKRLFRTLAERASWAVGKYEERSRLRDVLDISPALIATTRGPEHVCEFTNRAFHDFFEKAPGIGARIASLGMGDLAVEVLDRAYRTGEATNAREVPLTVDWHHGIPHETRYLDIYVQRLRTPLVSRDDLLVFAIDVSAKVQARQEIERHQIERIRLLESERAARTEAEMANRAKDEFLATVSHELRTPLNAVIGWTALARASATPEVEHALAIIDRNARSQARIIEDMLDISRVISGQLRLEPRAIRVSDTVAAALESARPAAEAKGVVLEASIEDCGVIVADPERLQQIVWNLLSNAIKFTPRAGRVMMRLMRTGERATIEVTDTGRGIEPEFLPQVFEAFRQADGSATRGQGGLGLGLAIVKQLVTAHGGTIRAESEGLGHGSTFTIELPASSFQTGIDLAREVDGGAASTEHLRVDGLDVLVVDDEIDARALFAKVLSARGAKVRTASSMSEALAMIDAGAPDVLVSDIAMPDGDGYMLIRAVRGRPVSRGGKTPAIAVTAYARREDIERAFAAGFQQHVEKPVELGKLISLVANLGGRTFGGA